MSNFQLYPGLTLSIEHNSAHKNLFLVHLFVGMQGILYVRWTKKLILLEPLVLGIRTWNLLFCHSKVFRIHAILQDVAAAVQSHSRKSPGYCYMFCGCPNSYLLDHVTELLFCLYSKFLLASISKSVGF